MRRTTATAACIGCAAAFLLLTVGGLSVWATSETSGDAAHTALFILGLFWGPLFLCASLVFGVWLWLDRWRGPGERMRWRAIGQGLALWLALGVAYWAVTQDYRAAHNVLFTAPLWAGFAWVEALCRAFGILNACGN